jgi:3-oxoacyl-[acyl-carrier protein] reductase
MPTPRREPPASEGPPAAVVTGGEGDLAAEVVRGLRASGWVVRAPGRRELDVADAGSVCAYFEAPGRVDLLVNAAGAVADRPLARMGEADWDRVVEVNLTGAFRCCRAVLPGMAQRRSGCIVNLGSFSGLAGSVGQANYAAAKAGLVGLTKALAREWGRRNIRVNCVLPGFLETGMTASLGERRRLEVLGEHVLGRFNTAADAARFIVLLVSLEGVSGQVFQLDSRVGRW